MMWMVPRLRPGTGAAAVLFAAFTLLVWCPPKVAAEEDDPLEGFNRRVHAFNDRVDTWILRPVAQGYDRVTPDPVQGRISNFFDNLYTPFVAINQVLQGKPKAGLGDLTRFVVNSTVGIGGLFDVARANNLPKHDEDFGQTFAVWRGGDQGVYLVIPFRGPSTSTHAAGLVINTLLSPLRLLSSDRERILVGGVEVIDNRAELLSSERLISGDEYLFIRDAFMQNRQYLIHDGEMEEDPFLDDDF